MQEAGNAVDTVAALAATVTPGERQMRIPKQDRTFTIPKQDRNFTIDKQDREYRVKP
jgi:hypothetical protein